jgi:protein tyrosine/serine phosphatase
VSLRKIPLRLIIVFFVLAVTVFSCAASERDPKWAEPVEVGGALNLHKVTEGLYRGAQPSREGLANLAGMGVKTVINLRAFHGDDLKGLSLREIRVPMHAWNPESEDVVRVMKILSDDSGGPYLVHCQHGADRTGMIIAVYRMVIQGWPRDEAIREMTDGGYGFHAVWAEIPKFLKTVDIDKIKALIAE